MVKLVGNSCIYLSNPLHKISFIFNVTHEYDYQKKKKMLPMSNILALESLHYSLLKI